MDVYKRRYVGNPMDSVHTESHGRLGVSVTVDSLGMATVELGQSMTLRLDESGVDKLREILFITSRALSVDRQGLELYSKTS